MAPNRSTRRKVIGTVGAAGAIALAGCSGGSGDDNTETPTETDTGGDGTETETNNGTETPVTEQSGGSLKIGVLQPFSGRLGFYGKLTTWGYWTAFGMKGVPLEALPGPEQGANEYTFELGDTTYEFITRDTRYSVQEGQSLAAELVRQDEVDMLLGVTNSGGVQTIANNVASQANIPLMAGPAASATLTNSDEYCSEYLYRTSETVEMDALSQGKYLANETDVQDVWIFHADNSFGQSIKRFGTSALESNGATIIGTTGVPSGYSEDWASQFREAEAAGAEAAIAGFTVATLPQMMAAYLAGDFSFRFIVGDITMFSAAAYGQVIQQAFGDQLTAERLWKSGLGPFTTRYHWNQYDNEYAQEANEIHRQKYGQNTDMYTAGAHAAISAIDQAVEQAGSTDTDDLLEEWQGMTIQETLKGEGNYQFQEYNNQARSSMSVAPPVPTEEPTYWKAPVQPGDPEKVFAPDETTLKADDGYVSCQL